MLAGDLGQFNDVIMNYKDKFIAEKTYTLIIRYVSTFLLHLVCMLKQFRAILTMKTVRKRNMTNSGTKIALCNEGQVSSNKKWLNFLGASFPIFFSC